MYGYGGPNPYASSNPFMSNPLLMIMMGMGNQPINPYYAQAGAPIVQQQQVVAPQQVILVPQQPQQVQQTQQAMPGYNPAATGVAPSAPTF